MIEANKWPTQRTENKYGQNNIQSALRSGNTERGLPQRTAVSVRCGMLHSKQTLLTIIFW